MRLSEQLLGRFKELAEQGQRVLITKSSDGPLSVDTESFQRWASSAMHLVAITFTEDSPHYRNLSKAYSSFGGWTNDLAAMRGVFLAAKADYEGGYLSRLDTAISGEVCTDFVKAAKAALAENEKDVAAVLACAALEDALKRFGRL